MSGLKSTILEAFTFQKLAICHNRVAVVIVKNNVTDQPWLRGRLKLGIICWAHCFPGGSVGKESTCNVEDCLQCRRPKFDPWVKKIPGEGNGNPLQYSCLENSMDRGACQATVHGVTKSWTRLSDEHITSISNVVINFHFHVYTHTHTHTHTLCLFLVQSS